MDYCPACNHPWIYHLAASDTGIAAFIADPDCACVETKPGPTTPIAMH